ncbi:MAG: DUF177 domain-containing protein [Acidobacteria bacterium]|nr:DUF177 domain-containing protein [Acidobacteriota bacterium]
MFFSLTELEHHPIHFDVSYRPGEVQFPDEFKQNGDLKVAGTAELLRNTLGEIRLRGHVTAGIEAVCDRCLEPAHLPVDGDFDLFYRPAVKAGGHGEVHLEEGEIDLSFYEGDGVELREAIREHVLLSLPMRAFCRADCRGLCPVCGNNRNDRECGCAAVKTDPRLDALKQIR